MNVSGVGATPPQPPTPPVAPAAAVASAAGSDCRPSGEPQAGRPGTPASPGTSVAPGVPGAARAPGAPGEHGRETPPHPAKHVEAPPLRMLTVTEMRIMLGQLPVTAGLKPAHHDEPDGPTAAA